MNEAPSFVMVEIAWPGFHLRFLATQKRIDHLLSLITPEVLESELDFKATILNDTSSATCDEKTKA